MKPSSHNEFITSLHPGDIGVICANNFFARLQALYAHRFSEGPVAASHAFYVRNPPFITEANGIVIKGPSKNTTIFKYVGDETKCWVFRYKELTLQQLCLMNCFADAAEQTGGHYSGGGIWQFAKAWITGRQNESDEGGVFCSEFDSDIILSAGLPFISDRPSWRIDPTYLLNWMLGQDRTLGKWQLAANYDGQNYFVKETV